MYTKCGNQKKYPGSVQNGPIFHLAPVLNFGVPVFPTGRALFDAQIFLAECAPEPGLDLLVGVVFVGHTRVLTLVLQVLFHANSTHMVTGRSSGNHREVVALSQTLLSRFQLSSANGC